MPPPELHFMTAFECLDANTLNLMKASPQNPLVRGLILKNAGVWVPEDLTTFEQFEQWLKGNPAVKPAPRKLSVSVSISEDVRGTARFTGTRYGAGEFEISQEKLIQIAGLSEDAEDFENRLRDYIYENASGMIETELQSDSLEYSHHDEDETTDSNTEFSSTKACDDAMRILQAVAPEIVKNLNGEE